MVDQSLHIEEPLLIAVSKGDQSAFTALFRKYSGLVYAFLSEHTGSSHVADDLVQDIFTKIWLSRESLIEIRQFRSFLFVLARNHALNDIKKCIRERRRHTEWMINQLQASEEKDQQRWDAQLDIIEQAVELLPEQQQKVWIMSRRKAMKYHEIAAEMRLSKETVKKYIQHANSSIIKYVSSRIEFPLALVLLKFL
ncbi:MAG: sigma-70 family RNA polymerase sigma factor [Chitinophagaceae bacterium]|nr:sigma-70 family RNA polymerase sigma factor [Chitinophagaceae bacterium]